MLKRILIISTFFSFCFGQFSITEAQNDQITKKINDLNNEIVRLKSLNETLMTDGNNLGKTEKSADDMFADIKGLIESYETNIVTLTAEIAEIESKKIRLEGEKGIHQKYHDELDSMRIVFQDKLNELADKHRDVTNFRDEMVVKLEEEVKSSLDD